MSKLFGEIRQLAFIVKDIDAAMNHWAQTQQHDDAPSIYREYLECAEGGLQHVSSWVTTQELLTRKAELVSRGYAIAQECTIPSSGVQLVYFDTGNPAATFMFEMADLMEPDQYQRVLGIRLTHEQWSGEPVAVEVGA